jgi:hypothetical protein
MGRVRDVDFPPDGISKASGRRPAPLPPPELVTALVSPASAEREGALLREVAVAPRPRHAGREIGRALLPMARLFEFDWRSLPPVTAAASVLAIPSGAIRLASPQSAGAAATGMAASGISMFIAANTQCCGRKLRRRRGAPRRRAGADSLQRIISIKCDGAHTETSGRRLLSRHGHNEQP